MYRCCFPAPPAPPAWPHASDIGLKTWRSCAVVARARRSPRSRPWRRSRTQRRCSAGIARRGPAPVAVDVHAEAEGREDAAPRTSAQYGWRCPPSSSSQPRSCFLNATVSRPRAEPRPRPIAFHLESAAPAAECQVRRVRLQAAPTSSADARVRCAGRAKLTQAAEAESPPRQGRSSGKSRQEGPRPAAPPAPPARAQAQHRAQPSASPPRTKPPTVERACAVSRERPSPPRSETSS